MKKELLKGFTMLALLVIIAFATALVSANAQSAQKVTGDIPFDFVSELARSIVENVESRGAPLK
jgi:hypothetical protein